MNCDYHIKEKKPFEMKTISTHQKLGNQIGMKRKKTAQDELNDGQTVEAKRGNDAGAGDEKETAGVGHGGHWNEG